MNNATFGDGGAIVRRAQSIPDLIAAAREFDPTLAKALTDKALIASKSTWGPAIGAGVAWVVSKYGLGWDADTSAAVSGGIVLIVSAVIRSVTSGPISGVFSKGPSA